ncbi:MAG: hypothetical protein RIF32_11880 [Leptospirales bacterium]
MDSVNRGLDLSVPLDPAANRSETASVRDRLRAALRPVFELSLLLICGLGAVTTIALRCRRTERARLRNLRQLRLLSSLESGFPARLSAEIRGLLARVSGRSEVLLDSAARSDFPELAATVAKGLRADAETLGRILHACSRLERRGPALKNGRLVSIDLEKLVLRLNGAPPDPAPPGPVLARSDPELLELALDLILRVANPGAAPGTTPAAGRAISIHRAPTAGSETSRPDADETSPPDTAAERVLLILHSDANHTLPGLDAGLAIAERILLGLGGKLRVTTEHSQGSNLEVELPL